MRRTRRGFNPMLVIPRTFEECFTYAQQIAYIQKEIDELRDADITELTTRINQLAAHLNATGGNDNG